ncbi:hypothetical protein [Gulosibacter chungangensis]|uniref:Glycosyl transferase n=1 Tax=Gulosibacter chungangensis TaxID=979746 RepID=A0A7J5BA83_9MICO|nr:hypothetical protein [Gulosibacter chungangensis]KAB1642669.1 hypothetical protein F8O05_09405 [Gulosibacter chungangensis]
MRFILAAVAFVASVIMLIVGGVQYSQAANVSEVTAVGTADSTAPITVISHDILASRAGTQSMELTGDGEIFVAVGRTDDVTAWVGDALHNTVTLGETADSSNGHTTDLTFTETGTEATVPSPAGNDLWFEEHTGEGSLSLDLVVSPGYSVLIASDGTAPAPSTIEISWPFGGYAPMVGPLLTAGLILLVLALALLAWALLHRRRVKREDALAAKRDGAKAAAIGTEADAQGADAQGTSVGPWSPVPWVDSVAAAEPEPAAPVAETETESAPSIAPTEATPAAAAPEERPESRPEAFAPPVTPVAPVTEPEPEPEPASTPVNEASPFAPPVGGASTAEPAVEAEPVIASEPEPASDSDAVTELEPVAQPETAVAEPQPVTADDSSENSPKPQATAAEATSESSPESGEAEEESKWRRPRGRNRSSAPKRQFFVAPLMVVASLTLAGCAPQYWPTEWTNTEIAPTGTPTSTVEAALIEEGAMPPTLNEAQLEQVIADAAALAAEADAALDASILEPRFTADALQNRTAVYKAKTADDSLSGPVPFPTGDIVYAVPEATDSWPRVVFAVVNPGEDAGEGASPAAVMLVQEDPRANFKVASLTELAAGVALPEAAPVSVGAPSIANLEGDLVLAPDQLAAAYADIIAKGDASEYAALFDPNNDALRSQVNDAYRDGLSEELDPEVISISFAYAATGTEPIGITSIDGGAIVAVSIAETETLEAANDRALITVAGRTAALSGVETSETGFVRTYTDQLLFYVPSAETGGTIQFLGVSQSMTDAKEIEES